MLSLLTVWSHLHQDGHTIPRNLREGHTSGLTLLSGCPTHVFPSPLFLLSSGNVAILEAVSSLPALDLVIPMSTDTVIVLSLALAFLLFHALWVRARPFTFLPRCIMTALLFWLAWHFLMWCFLNPSSMFPCLGNSFGFCLSLAT